MKKIVLLFSILFFALAVDAAAKAQHGDFNLYGSFTLVVEDDENGAVVKKITELLDSLKCRRYALEESCKDGVPCFIVRHTPIKAASGRNVFVSVNEEGVAVDYNNHATVTDIMDNIERRLVVRRNKRGIVKGAWLTGGKNSERLPNMFVDLCSRTTDVKSIRAQIKKSGKSDFDKIYLMVFTNSGAGIKNSTFNQTAQPDNVFMRPGALTSSQLSALINAEKETRLVLMINLFKNNRHFREVTGHSLFSDEGMRFVDDFMKGLFYKKNIPFCQLNVDCTDEERKRFVEPLLKQIEATGTEVEYNIINN